MRNRVAGWMRIAVMIGAIAVAIGVPFLLGQGNAQIQVQVVGCQSAAAFRGVNWNEVMVNLSGYDANGNAVFVWVWPSTGQTGTCVADPDGNAIQFTVASTPPFQVDSGLPAFSSQLEACRNRANMLLPRLTWNQIYVGPTAYPLGDGTSTLRWYAPPGLPTGTCVVDTQGNVIQITIQ